MRESLCFKSKEKKDPFVVEGKTYRSQWTFTLNGMPLVLYTEHASGKPAGMLPRKVENGKANAGIKEARERYSKFGAQAIIKSMVQLDQQEMSVINRFALKCFYKRERNNQPFAILPDATAEAATWQSFGQRALAFSRTSEYRSMVGDKTYLLMPWVEGSDLYQLFSSEEGLNYGINRRLQILNQIHTCLQGIGRMGQVFPDCKIENIMYDPSKNKAVFVDMMFINNGEIAKSATRDYLEKEKKEGLVPWTFDWQDQMYGFGLIAYAILRAPYESDELRGISKLLSHMMRSVFSNVTNRAARPQCADGFTEVLIAAAKKTAGVRVISTHNPYSYFSGRQLVAVEAARSVQKAPAL